MKKKNTSYLKYTVALLVADAVFFGITNPARVPSWAIMIAFGLFSLTIYSIVLALIKAARWYGLNFIQHRRRLALSVTGFLVGLAALQSINQLSIRDVTVLTPLALLGYLYVVYMRAPKETPT